MWMAFLLRGTASWGMYPSSPLFTFPVGVAATSVGFMVTVGNIWGGVYARNMGFKGLPSNP